MQKNSLLIDDVRTFDVEHIARTPEEAKRILKEQNITHLYLDHDLGVDESGYDIVNWAIENDCLPKWIQIVSMNPVGRMNIERALRSEGYVCIKGFWITD